MSDASWKTKSLALKLKRRLKPGHERGGFILNDGTLVEIKNTSDDPDAFAPAAADVFKHADAAVATWHTHPEASANLSVGDFETFVSWPSLTHIIVGTDGIRYYAVKNGLVINA